MGNIFPHIHIYIRIPIALGILVIGGLLAKVGMKTVFGEKKEVPSVITTGVFTIVRHPIYLGAMLVYLGLILLTVSLLSVLWWMAIILFYYLISRYEEKFLLKRFGSKYMEYKKKVPRRLNQESC